MVFPIPIHGDGNMTSVWEWKWEGMDEMGMTYLPMGKIPTEFFIVVYLQQAYAVSTSTIIPQYNEDFVTVL